MNKSPCTFPPREIRLAKNPWSLEAIRNNIKKIRAIAADPKNQRGLPPAPCDYLATIEGWIQERRCLWTAANRGLVRQVVNRYVRPINGAELSPDDAEQEGLIGLLRATELYDARRMYHFGTYAYRWIWQHVLRYRHGSDMIHLPEYLFDRSLERCLPAERERRMMARERRTMHLADTPYEGPPEELVEDRHGDLAAEEASFNELKLYLKELIDSLPAREGEVIRCRYFEHLTLEQTADALAARHQEHRATRERMRQIESQAMRRLLLHAADYEKRNWKNPEHILGLEPGALARALQLSLASRHIDAKIKEGMST